MKGIEENIKQNKNAFNSSEPDPDHFSRFESKLDDFHNQQEETWFERYGLAIRIAAAVILFVGLGSFFYSNLFDTVKDSISERIVAAELPDEVQEVMQYYNVITSKKVAQIDELAVSQDEAGRIKKMALMEIKALDEHRAALEKEYALNPNNDRIMSAMLKNQQQRSEILDKIINTLNQVN